MIILQEWFFSSLFFELPEKIRIIKEKKSSQHHDIDCVEFLDTLNFDNAAVDDDYINYLDQTI